MNRRRYLARSTATIGALASLAGCLDDLETAAGGHIGGSDEGVASESPDEASVSAAEREVDREIDRAVGKINKAGLSMAAVGDELDEAESVEFDPSEPRERIDAAHAHLDSAEDDATDEQRADVEELRAYADVIDRLVDVTESVVERDVEADIDAVGTAIDEERFDDANATIRDQRTEIDAARERLDPAIEALAELDRARLESLDAVDIDRIEEGATTLSNALEALDALTVGFESIVEGYEHLARGQAYVDDREFGPAKKAFEAARVSYEEATTTLETGRQDAPGELRAHFETASCQTGHLAEASTRFAESAEAAADGNAARADEKREEGETAIEAAENCDG